MKFRFLLIASSSPGKEFSFYFGVSVRNLLVRRTNDFFICFTTLKKYESRMQKFGGNFEALKMNFFANKKFLTINVPKNFVFKLSLTSTLWKFSP